ncbi:DeoR/GlpR family DNA-binding transcription regulator [Granulosicoccus antarcticus]|uniref:HTH-type transcriptional regulator UlaR n=1 Tax=Granulosicoccus antarcticus IMCC3135 TaxID=1192854 RepID=A0A2Z2NSJ5_9GAMM|nr:DeoR/GlpR family DNA-binding transcription regulator [Granulosicoccus antarcticus]ASJ74269.1 HTH-type transcriptional regulator UlaR [Granulosicoccus antarcticus IMCC3135]
MHERERQKIILSVIQERPVATVAELVELTDSSEATIRRDIASLHLEKKLKRVRGGAEALLPPAQTGLAGRPFSVNQSINVVEKRAIAREAAALCVDGEALIISGGTSTFQMVHLLTSRRLQICTNSFPIAEHLLHNSKNQITMPGGTIYREQNIILSPFENDVTKNFYAHRMFMGVHSVGRMGLMESDPLVIQSELKLMAQTDELVVLADASKFKRRSSQLICSLERIDVLITDERIDDATVNMLENADVRVIVATLKSSSNSLADDTLSDAG